MSLNNKKEVKKICISLLFFIMISLVMSYFTNIKINALEQEKIKICKKEPEYKGDCSDKNMDFSDDIVIKIIEKMDSSLDIKKIELKNKLILNKEKEKLDVTLDYLCVWGMIV